MSPRTARVADAADNFIPEAYVDYARTLTADGGIAISYKDLDLRFRITLRRICLWAVATGIAAWFVTHHSPVHSLWLNLGCLFVAAIANWFIVAKPVEVYRSIEIRPDCMVLENRDVFWVHLMSVGLPEFRPGQDGMVLTGIYGTRFVEYLTVRRFDEFDRAPEVLDAQLRDAMTQLWEQPR